MVLLLAALASFVPRRYRVRVWRDSEEAASGAVLSSAIQVLGSLAAIMIRMVAFYNERAELAHRQIFSSNPDSNVVVAGASGSGIFLYFEYLMQPLTVLLWYFALEGAVRLYAAVATHETIPTLPIQLIAWVHDWTDGKRRRNWLGPLVVDEVKVGDGRLYDLRIESCRPREWSELQTIEYKDELYEVADMQQKAPPRRFIYLLRKKPENKIIRGLHHYSPDELLPKE